MNPKVFISHASEDKDRFVIDFTTKLRKKGVDAWLDKWEMLPGDSLVDKIFEEGIKEADSFIIVLSNNSINKPWVKEELNASFVKRINKNTKIIPILIDNCTVPECLQSTVWENISDVNNYSNNFNRILNSIHGVLDKPAIGEAPSYVTTKITEIQGLNKIDTIIFAEACNKIMTKSDKSISLSEIDNNLKKQDISDEDISETLEILDSKNYIEATRVIGGLIPFFTVTTYGFEQYVQSNIQDYNLIVNDVCLKIINQSITDNLTMENETKYKIAIINHIFDILENNSLISFVKLMGGAYKITNISSELKRKFR